MTPEAPFLGRGWAFPPAFGAGGGEVETVAGAEDVEQSLSILLATMPGERVMRERFGCDLTSLAFEEVDRNLHGNVERLVSDAILEHEPRIRLEGVDVEEGRELTGLLRITVHYVIRGSNSRYNLVYPFYLDEASIPV